MKKKNHDSSFNKFLENKTKLRISLGVLVIFILSIYFTNRLMQTPSKGISIQGRTMGTNFTIRVANPPDNISQSFLLEKIKPLLWKINQQMSHWIDDSELSQFNASPAKIEQTLSTPLFKVLNLAQDISLKTQGAFDITIAPSVDLWGFGAKEVRFTPPSIEAIAQKKQQVNFKHLILNKNHQSAFKEYPLRLDLSAIAKGFAVDVIGMLLEQLGADNYLVEIGGEIRAKGKKSNDKLWRIAIEAPPQESFEQNSKSIKQQAHTIINIPSTGLSIATSGNYRNYFSYKGKKYSHTIDPKQGKPITNDISSMSVFLPIANNTTARVDALATALTVMGRDKALKFANQHGLAVLILTSQGSTTQEFHSSAFSTTF